MKKFLKIIIVKFLYRVEIIDSQFSEKKNKYRWTFKFYPKKIPVIICFFILSPFIFIKDGLSGIRESWKDSIKPSSWSSYEIWSLEKPKKNDCYSKF